MPSRFHTLFHLLLVLLLAAGCVTCAAPASAWGLDARDSRWAAPVQADGLPNLFQVTPVLYRSAQPEENGMRSAERLGIRTVLSLRTSNKDPELAENTDLLLERVPVRTWDIDDEDVVAALRVINIAPKPVLVHCYHGADRTGLVIAMYRMVFQGWSKEDAKEELINGGYGFHVIWINITRYIDKTDVEDIRARVLQNGLTAFDDGFTNYLYKQARQDFSISLSPRLSLVPQAKKHAAPLRKDGVLFIASLNQKSI